MAVGQTATAELVGQVSDPSNTGIVHARVALISADTGAQREAYSGPDGYFVIPILKPGSYWITIQKEGFRPASHCCLSLSANQIVEQNIRLSIGTVFETVEVPGDSDMIQPSSVDLGVVIGGGLIGSLPLNGRNFTQLLTLSPGVSPVNTSQSAALNTDDGSTVALPGSAFVGPSLSGQYNRSLVYYLDGIINTDFRTTTYTIVPNVDLIEEFKIQSHSDKAEFGSVTGGTVTVISRSGTNEFRGSLYEFLRNDAFDARDPFFDGQRSSPSPFRQNQFGATLSGPVQIPNLYRGKSRTFVSCGYEGWRYSKPSGSRYTVPTDQELAGDFSDSIIGHNIYDPLTTRPDPNNPAQMIRTQFPWNIIPTSRIDPMTQGFIKAYFDRPNYNDPNHIYNVIINTPQLNENDSWQIRVDHQISQAASTWFRYSGMDVAQATPVTLKSNRSWDMQAKNVGAGFTGVLSPSVLLEVRGGYAGRPFWFSQSIAGGFGPMTALGYSSVNLYGGLQFNLLSPWSSVGYVASQPRRNPVWSVSPNLSVIRGAHNLKIGFQWVDVERLQVSPALIYGFDDATTANPSMPGSTGASLASALLGLPQNYAGRTAELSKIAFGLSVWAAYIQDEWKARRNVTITLGLRFDHVNPVNLHSGMNNGPNMATGNWEIGAKRMPASCSDAVGVPCIPGGGLANVPFSDHIVLAGDPTRWRKQDWKEFGPRASIAWRVAGNLVVRAGYGLFYDALPGQSQIYQNGLNSWPFSAGFSGLANATGQPPTYINSLVGNYPRPVPDASPWTSVDWFSAPNRQDAYSNQWNVEIQRQITGNVMVSAAYVGSVNRRTDVGGIANVAQWAGMGDANVVNSRKRYPWMGTFFYDDSIGSSSYNALDVKMERRFARGFQALLSYTWSKSIDTGSSGYFAAENGAGGSSALQNIYDLKGSRSVSSYDIPHFLSLSVTWDVPFGSGQRYVSRGLAARILGNWQTNAILQVRSGIPYNLSVAGDVANIGNNISGWNYGRPNLAGYPRVPHPTAGNFFNPHAFSIPQFSYGNFGRNVLRTEAAPNVDFSLLKRFPILGDTKRSIEFRAEAFNVFNIMALGTPGTTIGMPDAGIVTSVANSPRVVQLALKAFF